MKLVYAGYKQMDKFNLCIKEMKYAQIKPRQVFETDETNGARIVKKYPDVYKLEDYEKKFGLLKHDDVSEKQKKAQKDKMQVKVQLDKSENTDK
jgi:hypothetical protein